MTLQGFDPAIARDLERFTESHRGVVSLPGGMRKLALFDADGTLWHGDLGEAFFRHQAARGLVPRAPKNDSWSVYWNAVCGNGGPGVDAATAFGWLAQWNEGVLESDLTRWCEEFFEREWKHKIFKPMQGLVSMLHGAGFECWVVSGSIKWAVAAGAKHYDIPFERVIGTAVAVEGGRLTGRLEGVVPYRGGKATMIDLIIKQRPLFAAGNTYWDKELICASTEFGLAIQSERPGESNHESEQKLAALAAERGWRSQRF